MLKIPEVSNSINIPVRNTTNNKKNTIEQTRSNSIKSNTVKVSSDNLKAYIPSFSGILGKNKVPTKAKQLKIINKKLDQEYQAALKQLNEAGILDDTSSNDGTSVLDNLYKIATEPRIQGLSDTVIIQDVIRSLYNPFSITQKFGDIPSEIRGSIEKETGETPPEQTVESHSCAVASLEFNLAMKKPAEFARFAQGLSSSDYSVTKNIKMSDFSSGTAEGLWNLRTFNTDNSYGKNWEDVSIKIKPDRNAIVRARVQTSYKDPNERSCVDVLIQSALLNLGSEHTYNSLTDKRTGELNPDDSGLTDFEKNFVEQVIFESPKVSILYQHINMDGYLEGSYCTEEEKKQHILKTLELGENVIIGITEFDNNQQLLGGHEITIIDYKKDENGKGYFICNDTDDDKDYPISIEEQKLLPKIHHAGIPKAALSERDEVVEGWRDILSYFKEMIQN